MDEEEAEKKEQESWHGLEPLPPLDQILPEHIAYVRSVVARFSVTPTYWREDLVQEILLEAHRSRESPLEVRALLFGITRHVVFRWMAKRDAERTAVALHPGRDANRSVEDDWQEAERREAVRASIDELPEIFREVFVRTEIEHMSMPEVVKELGIPLNTGYTRLHLARARFLESLQRFLARRRIQKQDLSAPVAIAGAASALRSEIDADPAQPDAPTDADPAQPDAPTDADPAQPDAPAPTGEGAASFGSSPAVLDTAAPSDPIVPAVHKAGAAAKVGGLGASAPWIGGGLVAATAVAVGVWIARSPDPGSADPIATPEPPTTTGTALESTGDTSSDPGRSTGDPDAPEATAQPSSPVSAPSAPRPPTPTDASSVAPLSARSDAPSDSGSSEEGLAARAVMGLVKIGKREEAHRAAEAFRRKYPNSMYIHHIHQALAAPPGPPDDTGR